MLDPIRTERLTLVACDAALIETLMLDPDEFDARVRRHPQWPQPELAAALPLMLVAAHGDPSIEDDGWLPWLVVCDGEIVGDVGAHGKLSADGTLEIGFSVVPERRGRGIASEAVRAFCDAIVERGSARTIVARVDRDNLASQRVLERAGFARDGDSGEHVRYERTG